MLVTKTRDVELYFKISVTKLRKKCEIIQLSQITHFRKMRRRKKKSSSVLENYLRFIFETLIPSILY